MMFESKVRIKDLVKLCEIVPFSIFILYIRCFDMNTAQDWNLPFLISGIAAFAAIILHIAQKLIFNRLFLGVNLYLISGAVAIVTHQWWLNKIYGELQAAGILAWVVIVGFACLLFSPQGFIGVYSTDKQTLKKLSLLLLFTSICTFGLSFAFRGDRFLSEVIPFSLIFFMHHTLKHKMTKTKEDLFQIFKNR